jgi:hypothetical protein
MTRTRTDRGDRPDADFAREDAATRHLCAGVYLERAFRWTVLHRIHNDPTRVIPPSYGFALNPVITHAWRAWAIETAQSTTVLAVLVVGFLVDRAAFVAVVGGLVFWFMVPMAVRYGSAAIALQAKEMVDVWLRRSRLRSEGFDLEHVRRLALLYLAGCAAAATMPWLAAGFAGVSPAALLRHAASLAVLIVSAVAVGGVVFRASMNGMHTGDSVEPRRLTRRQRAITEQQRRPYVIFRRPPSSPEVPEDPLERIGREDDEVSQFVGAGKLVHRWLPPLTVPLLPADADPEEPLELREYATPPFKAHELVRRLGAAVELLANADDDAATYAATVSKLPGLTVGDRLYVAEADVVARPAWLWQHPTPKKINRIIDHPHGPVHHFLEVIAPLRGGELVTSVFLRVTIKGRTLSLDFAACALTRTPDAYHVLDGYGQSGTGAVFKAMLRRMFDLPVEVARLWRLVEVPPLLFGAIRARTDGMPQPRCGEPSIREEMSTPWAQALLDEPVIHDYIKIIEQRLLATTEDFLAGRKLDTSTFHRRAQRIINQGVLNMGGGSIEVHRSAVGPGAQVHDEREMPGGS